MTRQLLASLFLAWRDWKHEALISLCAVLALASMLTPLLVLQGLKNGVIQSLRSRLLEDPAILIITPRSDAGNFSPQFISWLSGLPGASYAIGRTRETSTDISVARAGSSARQSIALEPAGPGEPVLAHYGLAAPENGDIPDITLSATAANALGVKKGDALEASIGRRTPEGRLESVKLGFNVNGILPIQAADRKMGFVALSLLEDLENYRDYLEVKRRGFGGIPNPGQRKYASFRLYAKSLDAVESLAQKLENENIEVITRARDIAGVRMLEKAVNQVILIVSLAVGAGFVAYTLSSAQSAVTRKKRMLGMLRLLGFRRFPLMVYPTMQTVLTAACGFILSLLLYLGVSFGIARAFASQQGFRCQLGFHDIGFAALIVFILSALCALRGAKGAAAIDPSIVIREV